MSAASFGASPPTSGETPSRALLIGVSKYISAPDTPTSSLEPSDMSASEGVSLQNLNGPVNDVRRLQDVLTAGGAFQESQIKLLPDPGFQDLRVAVMELLNNRRNFDTVLLYYSGHGWLDENESLYLCPSDAGKGPTKAWMIESKWISELLEECRAKTKIVILDCCFAGRFKGDSDEERLSQQLLQSVTPGAREARDEGSSPTKGVTTPSTDSRGLFVLCAGRGRIPDGGSKGEPSPFTQILAQTLEDMFGSDSTAIDMGDLFKEIKARVGAEGLLIRPSHRIIGESVVLARKMAARARRTLPEVIPSWPHIDLTFVGSTVSAKLPDGRVLPGQAITTRQLPHDSLLAQLLQLATDEPLCNYLGRAENSDTRQSLRHSLEAAYRLAGEDLFNTLFADTELREELFRHLTHASQGYSLELRLEMTRADAAITARRWETMAIPEDATNKARSAGPLVPRRGVLINRRVGTREQRSPPIPPSKSGGRDLRWVLLRSEFAQDHPLAARVQKDLDILADQSRPPALIRPPYAQFQQRWVDFIDHLDEESILLSMLIEVSGSELDPVLRFADPDFSQMPADRLVDELEDTPLSLVVLETLPPSGGQGNGFAAASRLAWSLSRRLACPVVAVNHPHSYVQWLRTDSASNDPDLCTVTGLAVRALCSSPGLDACLAHAARKGLQNKAPSAGIPVVYLPNEPSDAEDGHRGHEGDGA